jgi:hypothetical protein
MLGAAIVMTGPGRQKHSYVTSGTVSEPSQEIQYISRSNLEASII